MSIGYYENIKRMFKVLAKLGLKQIDRLRVRSHQWVVWFICPLNHVSTFTFCHDIFWKYTILPVSILQDLFRDTPLDHIWGAQICAKNAYLAIFGIFEFFWAYLLSILCWSTLLPSMPALAFKDRYLLPLLPNCFKSFYLSLTLMPFLIFIIASIVIVTTISLPYFHWISDHHD